MRHVGEEGGSTIVIFLRFKVISKEQGQALASEYGVKFLETSAKSNINVEEAFFTLARDIKKRLIDTADAGAKTAGNVNLTDGAGAKSGCCK